jgi:hypothetical protein
MLLRCKRFFRLTEFLSTSEKMFLLIFRMYPTLLTTAAQSPSIGSGISRGTQELREHGSNLLNFNRHQAG